MFTWSCTCCFRPGTQAGASSSMEWDASAGATNVVTSSRSQVRWLPPMAIGDLYNIAASEGVDVSLTSFKRIYSENWKKVLP